MNNIDNRPKILGTVTAFRENNLSVKVEVEQDIDFTIEEVRVEIWDQFKILYPLETFTIDENNVYVELTKAQVKVLPTLARCQVVIRDNYTFGYNIIAELGFGLPIGNSFKVSIDLKGSTGDITPEAAALALQINNQALQVEADTEAVGLSAQQVEAARQQVAADKVVVQGLVDGAESALANKSDRFKVATYADAVAFSATLPDTAWIEVVADETQDGIRAMYWWNMIELLEPLLL